METPIKILVIGNRFLVRQGMATWIASEPELRVIGEVTNENEALTAVMNSKPDVALIDLTGSEGIGIETIKQIENNDTECRILAIISSYELEKILHAMIVGAIGFIQDDVSQQELLNAIRTVFHGRAWISTDLLKALMKWMFPASLVSLRPRNLNKMEADVARLAAQGLSDPEIAATLHLKIGNVRFRLRKVFIKLQLKNRTQLAWYFLREKPDY